MMISHLSEGPRCDDHVGEPFPPRCSACDLFAVEADVEVSASAGARAHLAPAALPVVRSWAECPLHPGYPDPCARCARELEESGPS